MNRPSSVSLIFLVSIGLVSAALFSLTFVLNYHIAMGEGHWVWTAVLRYAFTIIILFLIITLHKGWQYSWQLLLLFKERFVFWILVGTLACGLFYTGLAFAAEHMRGWAVAATFQLTVIFSPFILLLMGYRLSLWVLPFSMMVLIGTFLVNWVEESGGISFQVILYGLFPVIVSAISYPLGNQLLNIAKNGGFKHMAAIQSPVLNSAFSNVLLMSLGSIPFWVLLVLITQPPAPSQDQYLMTFIVALFAGVLATSIFIYARNKSSDPIKIVAVDSTQATEVVFALLLELIFVNHLLPSPTQLVGLSLVILGLLALTLRWDQQVLKFIRRRRRGL